MSIFIEFKESQFIVKGSKTPTFLSTVGFLKPPPAAPAAQDAAPPARPTLQTVMSSFTSDGSVRREGENSWRRTRGGDRPLEINPGEWGAVAQGIRDAFATGRYIAGGVAGLEVVSVLLARQFPREPGDASEANELPDRPVLL